RPELMEWYDVQGRVLRCMFRQIECLCTIQIVIHHLHIDRKISLTHTCRESEEISPSVLPTELDQEILEQSPHRDVREDRQDFFVLHIDVDMDRSPGSIFDKRDALRVLCELVYRMKDTLIRMWFPDDV